jgi:hypothetical protein
MYSRTVGTKAQLLRLPFADERDTIFRNVRNHSTKATASRYCERWGRRHRRCVIVYCLHAPVGRLFFHLAASCKFAHKTKHLGAFAKFRKMTISFVMSVYPCIRLSVSQFVWLSVRMEQLCSSWTDYNATICRKNSHFITTWQE